MAIDLINGAINEAIIDGTLSDDEKNEIINPPKQKKRRGRKGVVFYTDENGIRKVLPPILSFWYNYYCSREIRERSTHTTKWLNKFRRRFSLPYKCFLELVDMAIADPNHFQRWKPGTTDAVGKECAPIHLLVLTSLRYMGRGWTFDDLEEATAISESVCREFFHEFVLFGTRVLYPKYVHPPHTTEEAASISHEFSIAGFPGCLGLMDATHISFGILKGRWRILKSGIRVHGIETADQIWLTCCALHNWLLDEDGLNQQWEEGIPSDWNGELGQFDHDDLRYIPMAVRRLNNPDRVRNYDSSGRGIGEDFRHERDRRMQPCDIQVLDNIHEQVRDAAGTVRVRKLTLNQFRTKLVTHFDITFRRNKIRWPTRLGIIAPAISSV